MKKIPRSPTVATILLMVLMVVATASIPAAAVAGPGPCAATLNTGFSASAIARAPAINLFMGSCTAAKVGPVVAFCTVISAGFRARWSNLAARTGDSTGGCSFMCGANSCFVGNDGLPVELLGFGVD